MRNPALKVRFALPSEQAYTAETDIRGSEPVAKRTRSSSSSSPVEVQAASGLPTRAPPPTGPTTPPPPPPPGASSPPRTTPPPPYSPGNLPGYSPGGYDGQDNSDDSSSDDEDCDHAQAHAHLGGNCAIPQDCSIEPTNSHPANHPDTICGDCRIDMQFTQGLRAQLVARFHRPVYSNVAGQMVLQNTSIVGPGWGQTQAYLCDHCERDEVTHWRRKQVDAEYAARHPRLPREYGVDSGCVCVGKAVAPWYCQLCVETVRDTGLDDADRNARLFLHQAARDNSGRRRRAAVELQNLRQNTERYLACRCGREVRRAGAGPPVQATFCITCEGVSVNTANINDRYPPNMGARLHNLRYIEHGLVRDPDWDPTAPATRTARWPLLTNGGTLDFTRGPLRQSRNGP